MAPQAGTGGSPQPPQADRIAVLAIAYHNIGVEQEFLKKYDQSVLSYRKGVEVAERYLGVKHPIAITLKNSLAAAQKQVATSQSKLAKSGKGGAGHTKTIDDNKLPAIRKASPNK